MITNEEQQDLIRMVKSAAKTVKTASTEQYGYQVPHKKLSAYEEDHQHYEGLSPSAKAGRNFDEWRSEYWNSFSGGA